MPRQIAPILSQIIAAIEGIEQSMQSKSFEDFRREWLLKHGIQRGIEIVSEASRHIPDELRDAFPDVPWKRIAGIGSVLRHEYHRISDAVIWNVVTEYLADLKEAVLKMQAELEDEA